MNLPKGNDPLEKETLALVSVDKMAKMQQAYVAKFSANQGHTSALVRKVARLSYMRAADDMMKALDFATVERNFGKEAKK